MELTSKDGGQFKKRKAKVRKRRQKLRKAKLTIMIVAGQRDSEVGEIDKRREQERETYVTLNNGRY